MIVSSFVEIDGRPVAHLERFRTESRLFTLIQWVALLALLINALGLVGLTAFVVEQKTKEIGVRKILGASVTSITRLLTRDYLKLVTSQLTKELAALAVEWDAANPKSYGAEFKTLSQREALGRIVNGMAILAGYEFMSERLAVALDSGDQEDEHSCFSDNTKQDFVHDLVGIKAVWTDAKIADLVSTQDAELATRVNSLFADAEVKIAALGDPWDQVLAAPKDSPARKDAEAVVVALQALASGLKEAGNKLGILVLIPTG